MTKNNSIVRKAFDGLITPVVADQIKLAFNNKNPDDDINISVDQTINLTQAIKQGLVYPKLKDDGSVDYNQLMEFLETLCKIFKWDKYESKTLGKRSKGNNLHGMLRWYGVILAQWISGHGLSLIIHSALEYKQKYPETNVMIKGVPVKYDYSLPQHRNVVIADTLKVIENIVLFRISNYFLRFSEEYKRIKNIKELDNDWYEFIEYGTTNPLTIFLQRNGFSRETATYIKKHKHDYVVDIDNSIMLKSTLLDCGSHSVRTEVAEIKYNVPELFR
jgi:hypothetical protein